MTTNDSRRRFLGLAACGAATSTWVGVTSSNRIAVAEPKSKDGNAGELLTYSAICPQHLELVLQRSQQEHQRIAKSLKATDARPVTVGAFQLANHCDGERGKQANLARMIDIIMAVAEKGVQVLTLPEMCLPGYLITGSPEEAAKVTHALADQGGKSEYLKQLAAVARAAKMVVAFGFCEHDGDAYYNAIGLIDADGGWLGSRRKNPLSPHPHETGSFTEPPASQRTAVFKSRYAVIGLANCFDGEFPESIRRMRLAGAELVLWCNAGTGNPRLGHTARINSSGSYAQSNRMWVVCCNAVADNFYGTSVIIGPSGEPLVVLPTDEESLGFTTVNLALLSDWDRWRSRLDPIWRHPEP